MPRSRRLSLLVVPTFCLLGALGGCGEPVVRGSGRIVEGGAAGPSHLIVEGTPYEMGYWQGRLLAERIRAFHGRWRQLGVGTGEAGRALESACRVYVDQTRRLLPEAILQELDGLAAGCGLVAADLLLAELQRDALRFHGHAPRLRGDLACRVEQGEVEAAFDGPGADARLLGEAGLLLERRPEGGTPTVLVTWPGSLGGVAGASATGLGVVSAAVALPVEQMSLGGPPFLIRVRRALERAGDVDDLLERLSGGTAHRVLLLDGPRHQALFGLAALSATRTADLTAVPFFEVAAKVPVGEAEVPSAPQGAREALRDWLAAADGWFGVRLEEGQAVVSLGHRAVGREAVLPWAPAEGSE